MVGVGGGGGVLDMKNLLTTIFIETKQNTFR